VLKETSSIWLCGFGKKLLIGFRVVPEVVVNKSLLSVIFSEVGVNHIYVTKSTTFAFLPIQVSHTCHDDGNSNYNIAMNE